MLLRNSQAILLTVFAISLVMYQEFYQPLKNAFSYNALSNTGIVIASFIIVGYLSDALSKRVRHIEALNEKHLREADAVNAINKKIVQIIEQGVIVISHNLEIIVANDTVINQLHLPTNISNFCLKDISPALSAVLEPLIKDDESSTIIGKSIIAPTKKCTVLLIIGYALPNWIINMR